MLAVHDVTALRLASEVGAFPWKSPGVTFLLLGPDGQVTQDHTVGGKRELAAEEGRLLAVWTGKYHSDVFEVDPPAAEQMRAVLGVR